MMKGPEGRPYQEHLKYFGLFSPEKRRPHCGLQLLHERSREAGADLSVEQNPREHHEAVTGSCRVSRKGSSPQGWLSTGMAPQGSGHGTEPARVKKCLDMLSVILSDFWMVPCGARSWTQ